jgi:hypothetical protein
MDFISKILSSYFTAENWFFATLEGILFIVGVYGICKILLFILRYYIIYNIVKKISSLIKSKNYYTNPTEKEDELLRDEEKEVKKQAEVENVTVEKLRKDRQEGKNFSNKKRANQGQEINEEDFKIYIPKAVGKWQKFVIGNRQNMILAVAKKMQQTGSPNFWQTLVAVQKEQSAYYNRGNKY